jgi:flagellar biosynthesis protein FlhG
MSNEDSKKPKIITITSGKGGVGKSIIAANMANILSIYGYKVALFDASLGLSNQDIILNVKVRKNLIDFLKGECGLSEIVMQIKDNFLFIPSDSGDEIFDFNPKNILDRFNSESSFSNKLDYIIYDTSSGIGEGVITFMENSDEIIVITEPTPCAITDAYATIKIASKYSQNISMILNRVSSSHEGNLIYDKIKKVAVKNLGSSINLTHLGSITTNQTIVKSSKYRQLFTDKYPNSLSSHELNEIIKTMVHKLEHKVLYSQRRKSFTVFVRRLIEKF